MIEMLTAHSIEIDEPELAIADILDQLELDTRLRKHSVGIITCHVDYIDSGAVAGICEKLPFDVVGCSSLTSAVNGEMGLDILTVSVLTSDDVSFTTTLTESLYDVQAHPIKQAYAKAAASLAGSPSFILSYGPLIDTLGAEMLCTELNEASGGIPNFGAIASDHTIMLEKSRVIYNGQNYGDRMAMVLMSGPVNPQFFFISVPTENMHKQRGIVTASVANVLYGVDGISVSEYLENIGVMQNGVLACGAFPLLVDYGDGAPPVCRAVHVPTPDGGVACAGDVPINTVISLATFDEEDVMRSASTILEKLQSQNLENKCLLIASCISRNLLLGTDPMKEAQKTQDMLGDKIPYHLCYAGGEICPAYTDEKKSANRLHNFSFTACLF